MAKKITLNGLNDNGERSGINIGVSNGGVDTHPAKGAGEHDVSGVNEYFSASPESGVPIMVTGTGAVRTAGTATALYSITVTVATATGAINVYNAATATGTPILIIPLGTAANTRFAFDGDTLDAGLFINYVGGATGTLRVASRVFV